jgi:hypothetical protein
MFPVRNCRLFRPLTGPVARSRAAGLTWVCDPRSPLGRWHPLEFVLALTLCAFTAVGHDSVRHRRLGNRLLPGRAVEQASYRAELGNNRPKPRPGCGRSLT